MVRKQSIPRNRVNIPASINARWYISHGPGLTVSDCTGDERPCLRCIKRGLQDACHDGVRKKAKYLHDAPAEALMPGFAGNYQMNGGGGGGGGGHNLSGVPGVSSSGPTAGMQMSHPNNYYPHTTQSNMAPYGSVGPAPMAGPMIDNSSMVSDFTTQPSVGSPAQYQSTSSQQVSPAQDLSTTMDASMLGNPTTGSFDGSFMDPNDPSLFNFNLSDLNFGNHYGALEFGMLGHMSSGAVGTPDLESLNQQNPLGQQQQHQGAVSYDGTTAFSAAGGGGGGTYGFNAQTGFSPWQAIPNAGSRQSSTNNVWSGSGMDAFAIGDHNTMSQSPHSQQDPNVSYTMSPENHFSATAPDPGSDLLRQSIPHPLPPTPQPRKPSAFPGNTSMDQPPRKRRRNPAEIYTTVDAPYSYTQKFHALTALLQRRFPSKKNLRIAKALATIRPSFISCNQNLIHDDLIFMEKCFQRTLLEYEDFLNSVGTPTLICRRTGEVAAVSKEFSLVTGWRKDVLLGKEANLNVNTGGGSSGSTGTQTGNSSAAGSATPRVPPAVAGAGDSAKPNPVFLAELMDEDSVVRFYEDFAELAFGASRSSVYTQVSLLKYKTKEDMGWGGGGSGKGDGEVEEGVGRSRPGPALIRGHEGMRALGEKEGRVECGMCFTVRHDVFDIPMLVVMNVSIVPVFFRV